MSFEISCHLRFHSVNLNLFQISIESFRTLKPISGGDGMGWDGRLSPFDGLLRAPMVLIRQVASHLKLSITDLFTGRRYAIASKKSTKLKALCRPVIRNSHLPNHLNPH